MAHNQIIEKAPALAPGCDFFTRSVRGPFVDTGVDIEANTPIGHRIYVCEDTVGEWATMLGWISPGQAAVLKEATLEAREDQEEAEAELDQLRHIVRALTNAGFSIPTENDVPEPEITEFPHHKGAGWWLLSNGEKIRGSRDEAEDAEADIAEALDQADEVIEQIEGSEADDAEAENQTEQTDETEETDMDEQANDHPDAITAPEVGDERIIEEDEKMAGEDDPSEQTPPENVEIDAIADAEVDAVADDEDEA